MTALELENGPLADALLAGAGEAMVATDAAFRVRLLNPAAERLLGVRAANAVGRPLAELLPGEYDASTPHAGDGWRFHRIDSGWAAYGTTAAEPGDGWVQRMVEAEQLAAVGQLAAGVAHEIGAPLTAISVAVEYLLKRECGNCPSGGRDLEVILTQTRRIAQLSRRLVDLARPAEPVLRPTDFNEVITEAMELLDRQLRAAGIGIVLDLDKELPWVRADRHQLQQVLLNIVLNAQRAMKEGGGRLQIRTRKRHRWVELVVSDTGPGIAPESLPRIFLPFFSESGGTGLGLPLARQIVHRHHGIIDVESKPGSGATFIVRLPREAQADD